jgi:ankyrin repeat protein
MVHVSRVATRRPWCACHGGQRETAEYLLDQGADINWIGHDKLTPVDAAGRSDAHHLADSGAPAVACRRTGGNGSRR